VPLEQDQPPLTNTFRRFAWDLLTGIVWARAYFGRRLLGTFSMLGDDISATATQAFFARLPGHPQQAADSLVQVGKDRGLIRFRGETDANWVARVQAAWDDYAQGGTDIQMRRVLNQWGNAGWPSTWNDSTWTLNEVSGVGVFEIYITIPFGLIDPPWVPITYGSGHLYGESGFFYGAGPSNDLAMLLYLVRKWKPSRSKAFITVYYSVSGSVTLTV
jgi:hypothetical protein